MKKTFDSFAPCLELREVIFLRTLPHHAHLVPALDIFLDPYSKKLHICMEFMDGNLYQLMKARDHQCMDGPTVKSILYQILSGLEHIHAHHFFHRDIKPESNLSLLLAVVYRDGVCVRERERGSERRGGGGEKIARSNIYLQTSSSPPYHRPRSGPRPDARRPWSALRSTPSRSPTSAWRVRRNRNFRTPPTSRPVGIELRRSCYVPVNTPPLSISGPWALWPSRSPP